MPIALFQRLRIMVFRLFSVILFLSISIFILLIYLSLAQINGNMQRSKQVAQRKEDATSQKSILVEDDLYEVVRSIPTQKATNMKDIAHHAQRAIVRQRLTARQQDQLGLLTFSWGRSVEPLLSPDNS